MGDIFVSHSRNDHNITSFMQEVCNAVRNANPYFFEFKFVSEGGGIPNEEIPKMAQNCSVMFVLLGKNFDSKVHTCNWVSSEVGLAKALNIPIWIIEESSAYINMPVPFVDHYICIDPGPQGNRNTDNHLFMQDIVEIYTKHRARSGDPDWSQDENTQLEQCLRPGCMSLYWIHQPADFRKNCPVCRKPYLSPMDFSYRSKFSPNV